MKTLVDSIIEAELGQGFKLKSQDKLIGKNGKFIYRLARQKKSNKNLSLDSDDNNLFFDIKNIISKFHITIKSSDDSLKIQEVTTAIINQFNKLNSNFYQRVRLLDENQNKAKEISKNAVDDNDDVIVTI
jgi:hypothetical protein